MVSGEVIGEPIDQVVTRVRAEFIEMPCLKLTAPQAQRLIGVPEDIWHNVSERLIEEGFLKKTASGTFALRSS